MLFFRIIYLGIASGGSGLPGDMAVLSLPVFRKHHFRLTGSDNRITSGFPEVINQATGHKKSPDREAGGKRKRNYP